MRGEMTFKAFGSVATDPDFATLNNGTARLRCRCVSNVNVKKGDKWEQEPVWYDLTFWGVRAEKLRQYMVKGTNFSVGGEVRNNNYDSGGVRHSTFHFNPNPNTLLLLPDGKDRSKPAAAPTPPPPVDGPPVTTGSIDEMAGQFPGDDDLPF